MLVRTSLDAVLASQSNEQLLLCFNIGQIEVVTKPQDKALLESNLKTLIKSWMDALITHCDVFLKLKPKPRFDIKTVKLTEVKTDRDVD